MTNRPIILHAAIALLVLAACFTATAQSRCTNKLIKGTYGYTCTGTIIFTQGGPAVPYATLGRVVSDGTGHWEGSATADIGGGFSPVFLTTEGGSDAVVDPDCTGTITYQQWTANPNVIADAVYLGPLPIHFVVSQNGNEIDGLPTGSGATVTCRLVRQFE